MSSLPLTLAALATSAVPGLAAVAVRPHDAQGTDYTSVVLTTEDDELIVSVPRTQQAETTQSASVLGLTALSEGARSELPFAVPEVRGMTRAGDTRAVVTSFLPGARFDLGELHDDAILIESIAETLAAIHALPQSIVQQSGLPNRGARDQRLLVTRVVDRAAATRYLPETVHRRWTEALEAAELWDFAPKTVHGALSDDALLVDDDSVIGVLDWSGLSVGDPASDLAWLIGAGDTVFEAVTERYLGRVEAGDERAFRARARLYHELEVARWLLHGVESHDDSVVDDAVAMLDRLVDRLSLLDPGPPERDLLTDSEVEDLLERTPVLADRGPGDAASEALDEDRMFGMDTDFIDPLPADAGDATDAELTAPIDDADLPPAQRD